ncbi:MAG TPA: response regulator [Alphaproteobacteria bacterium]|nr:response regulator [Alphaproteobacteria bacterium]
MAKTVLTVDDSKTMRDMVTFTLKSAGYDVVEAEDGVKALGIAMAKDIDVVITDLNMPNMNGIDLIKALRKNSKYTRSPILMLTTEGDSSKKEEGKIAGATGWIVKPFEPAKLAEVIKKVCPI